MPASPRRAVLAALLAVALGLLAVLLAAASGGRLLAPWWVLALVLCFLVPLGSLSARSARGRLVALAGVGISSALLVGGLSSTTSLAFVVLVLALFALAPATMLLPHLRGHRVVGLAVFAVPLLLVGAAAPVALGGGFDGALEDATAHLRTVDPATFVPALRPLTGPALLLGGAATLVGCVVDLASRLRTTLSAGTVRGIAFVIGGLALVLAAAAGAVAAGTLSGTALRVGTAGVVLVLAAIGALTHGLRALARTREVSRVGGILTVLAVLAVLVGALLAPDDALVTAITLVALLGLAGVLGAVTGLCGAAALVRTPHRERYLPRLTLHGWRTRLVQP